MKPSAPQLFAGSDDEDSDKDDGNRFDIRPQFEGLAGHKVRGVELSVFASKIK